MNRPCLYCNNDFKTNDFRRKTCGCKRPRSDKKSEIYLFHTYLNNMRKYFQDPINQIGEKRKRLYPKTVLSKLRYKIE